ncbi:VanZ family protein [Cohnella hashimotonis]|uniref:VanZ family protein n=1 Tax=Cohnella hashimotonis TaxID=2826895 RepID=A0ABT6TLX6_9BACL|nr:VanZ family protein [Cohnella hashimotonis]MDI4647820.1 VanZ family protein [Cohnella hashimotonis]
MNAKYLSPVLWIKLGAATLFAGYLYVLIKIILFKFSDVNVTLLGRLLLEAADQPHNIAYRLQFANLTPFVSIRENVAGLPHMHDTINLFGNIALFVPLGLFLGLFVGCRLPAVLFYALGVSLTLESAQLVFAMGSFDVDDMILNTLGGAIGYSLFAGSGLARGRLTQAGAGGRERS